MRKCSSAPQLAGNERQLHFSRAGSRGLTVKTGAGGAAGGASRKASNSCNALANLAPDDSSSPRKPPLAGQSLSSGNLSSLGSGGLGQRRGSTQSAGSPHALRASSASTFSGGSKAFSGAGGLQRGRAPAAKRGPKPPQAMMLEALPPPPHQQQLPFEQLAEEAGEWMMEGASHGIASTDCFELFGFPEDAPNLRDAGSPESKAQERSRRTAEAACLLTPATGQERDMGAQLHAAVRRAAVESDAQTQAKYAEEIRRQAAESLLEELDATLLSPDKTSPRRRRRVEDEKLDAEVLKIFVDDSAADAEPAANTNGHSPRTREALASMFAERQPTRNMLTIDEEDLPLASADVAASIDLPPAQAPHQVLSSPDRKAASPEFGTHPAYCPPLVLVNNAAAAGSSNRSTAGAAGSAGADTTAAAGAEIGSGGGGGGTLFRDGSGVQSPFAQHSANASHGEDDSLKATGAPPQAGQPAGKNATGPPAGVPALASVRPRNASTPNAVGTANAAVNAAPPAGGGASPGSTHPVAPPQPGVAAAKAPPRVMCDKATQAPDEPPGSDAPPQRSTQPSNAPNSGSGDSSGRGSSSSGSSFGGASGSPEGLKGTGRAVSNAVPFIRPRGKTGAAQDGAAKKA